MSKANSGYALNFRGANGILLSVVFFLTLVVFFSSEGLRAQMASLYSDNKDQVAGINSLMSAAANNDVEGVRFFSKSGAAFVNQKNLGGATALHIAAREKNLEVAKILVENGADVNAIDNEGWTPLMRASLAADAAFVSYLLEKNADAGALNSANETAIMQAAYSDCDACLSAMFEKYNFIKLMSQPLLTQQITDSYSVARNHENVAVQKILGDYLDRSTKMAALVDVQEQPLNGQVTPIYSGSGEAAQPKTVTKRFRFLGDSSGKPAVVEVVEPISIQNKELPNITSVPAPAADGAKVVYIFGGKEKIAPSQTKAVSMVEVDKKPKEEGIKIFKFKKLDSDEKVNLVIEPVKEVVSETPTPALDTAAAEVQPAATVSLFKFKAGEPSKKLPKKKIVKKKVVAPATMAQPTANAAPQPAPAPTPAAAPTPTTTVGPVGGSLGAIELEMPAAPGQKK